MNRNLFATAFAALSLFAAAPAIAGLDVDHTEGSRWDVRAWCTVTGGILSDREDYTMCVSVNVPGATFTCDADGACTRTGFDLIETGGISRPEGNGKAPLSTEKAAPGRYYEMPYSGGFNIVD